MGAGLVMFTIHADTSMKSEGGPGSAWSRRSPCLLTLLCPWCPGLSHSIRTPVGRLEARDEFNFISWPNHDGQWASQTWTGLRSLSAVSTDEHFFHYHKTDSQVVQLLTWNNSKPSIIALFQRWPHSPLSADLFYDEIKCIQVQSYDVGAVIVWLIPIFAYNWGSHVQNGEPKDWVCVCVFVCGLGEGHHAFQIILNNHRYVSKAKMK